MALLVLDTGALIAAERRVQRSLDYFRLAEKGLVELVAPSVCLIEWWRGKTDRRDAIAAAVTFVPLPLAVAKAAGLALAAMKAKVDSGLSIDAAVMAFAALVDAPVVTSDLGDMQRLQRHFRGVRLLSAS